MSLRAIAILCCLFWTVGLTGTTTATAEEKETTKTKKTVAMSQYVYSKLQEGQKMAEAGKYDDTHAILQEMLENEDNLSSYEKAQVWNLGAYTYYQQERYEDAVRSYEKVLMQEDIPEAITHSTLKTLSQLYFITEDYAKALETAQRLLRSVSVPDDSIYLLVGQAWFQLGKYREALGPLKKVIELNRERGTPPKENWLLLLRSIYYELKDYQSMLPVLIELTELYPKDEYLLTLAGVYSELGDTSKQLALTEPLYESGFLNPSAHAGNLASLYLLHGLPYKAATLMQQALKDGHLPANESNLKLLSQAWYQAREDTKAIPPLQKAAKLSDNGELYVRLAQSHINLEQWSAAADALKQAHEKGQLRRSDQVNIMLGIALFNQKAFKQAREAFALAQKDKRSAKTASQWIRYLDSEAQRENILHQQKQG